MPIDASTVQAIMNLLLLLVLVVIGIRLIRSTLARRASTPYGSSTDSAVDVTSRMRPLVDALNQLPGVRCDTVRDRGWDSGFGTTLGGPLITLKTPIGTQGSRDTRPVESMQQLSALIDAQGLLAPRAEGTDSRLRYVWETSGWFTAGLLKWRVECKEPQGERGPSPAFDPALIEHDVQQLARQVARLAQTLNSGSRTKQDATLAGNLAFTETGSKGGQVMPFPKLT